MSVVVFCGPTIEPAAVRALVPDADVRPPAARGDVLRAMTGRPAAIALIDGYFARVPAVWHKEILWAMSEGIHVFGAASMGALRAAELHTFGMEGVGEIFQAFATGALEDDDEVSVVHGPADSGYRALSDPLVNMRATFAQAANEGVIGVLVARALTRIAKSLPYPERAYDRVLQSASDQPALIDAVAPLRAWLPRGRVDRKREDALALLRRIGELARSGWSRKTVTYQFSRTDSWEALRAEVAAEGGTASQLLRGDGRWSGLREELLAAGQAHDVYAGGRMRAWGLEEARRLGARVNVRAVEAVIDDFRRERSLLEGDAFDAWLREQGLSGDEAVAFFEREAALRNVATRDEATLFDHVIDHLRSSGALGSLLSRAAEKRRDLTTRGLEQGDAEDTGLSLEDLWKWYFVERLGRPVPADLVAFARTQHATLDELRYAAAREYLARGSAARAKCRP